MSNYLYNFITESFLYHHSDNEWSSYQDHEIVIELEKYKEYTKTIFLQDNEKHEIKAFAGFQMPTHEFIRQTALYLDKLYIYDPLITFHTPTDSYSLSMNKYLGFEGSNKVNRKKLKDIINYLKEITPFVVHKYIEIIPYTNKPDISQGVPLFASDTQFKELLPDSIRNWFHNRVIVRSMVKTETSWLVLNKLEPSRGICITFNNDNSTGARIYNLFEQEIIDFDSSKNLYKTKMHIPDYPPDLDYFNVWVEQSINRSSHDIFNNLYLESLLCASLNKTMFISKSEFHNDVLNLQFDPNDGTVSKAANLALSLDLPIINEISNQDLMSVRTNHDSSFQSFRSNLERKVQEISGIQDKTEIEKRIKEYSYELTETNIRDIGVSINNVHKQLGIESIFVTSSLITSFLMGGWGIIPAAVSAFQGLRTYDEYRNNVNTNPSHLLWKMGKKVK